MPYSLKGILCIQVNSCTKPFKIQRYSVVSDNLYAFVCYLLQGWSKGNVFVNGFNLGRYFKIGPTETLYLPGPLLREGENQVIS